VPSSLDWYLGACTMGAYHSVLTVGSMTSFAESKTDWGYLPRRRLPCGRLCPVPPLVAIPDPSAPYTSGWPLLLPCMHPASAQHAKRCAEYAP
jgi:hypothetical protein